jgi:hypothetical protein
MRHPPMRVPTGSLQICRKFCQVSASCHISAMTPNHTADAPKTVRPYNAVFIQKRQRRRWFGPVAQARSFPLYLSAPCRRNAASTNSPTSRWAAPGATGQRCRFASVPNTATSHFALGSELRMCGLWKLGVAIPAAFGVLPYIGRSSDRSSVGVSRKDTGEAPRNSDRRAGAARGAVPRRALRR